MESKEKWAGISYKIMANRPYRVWRKEWNNKIYYNIQVSQTNYDGTISKWYRPITFKKGIEVPNETDIIIKKAVENLRPNAKDPYNPITALMILEFETVANQEQMEQQAYADYRANIEENETGVTDEMLPF